MPSDLLSFPSLLRYSELDNDHCGRQPAVLWSSLQEVFLLVPAAVPLRRLLLNLGISRKANETKLLPVFLFFLLRQLHSFESEEDLLQIL